MYILYALSPKVVQSRTIGNSHKGNLSHTGSEQNHPSANRMDFISATRSITTWKKKTKTHTSTLGSIYLFRVPIASRFGKWLQTCLAASGLSAVRRLARVLFSNLTE